MSVHRIHAWCLGQKKASDPVKLEFQRVVSCHVGAETQTQERVRQLRGTQSVMLSWVPATVNEGSYTVNQEVSARE